MIPASSPRAMPLCLFLASTGYYSASWRHPASDPLANITPGHFTSIAKTAEKAGFDAVFLADSMAVWSDPSTRPVGAIEPAVLASAILHATSDIGVIITVSTSYHEPFNVARRLSSLDHLGAGRIGWNIVTSATREAAQNFGYNEILDHTDRYRRAEEFVDVCLKLWTSWERDAIVGDKAGRWADPQKIRAVDHNGEFFKVRGPLDVPPSPQVVPLLVQAGSSDAGMTLAARYADFVFTVQSQADSAREFRSEVHARAEAAGADRPRVLPGLIPVVGGSDAEAMQRLADLNELGDPTPGIRQLEKSMGLAENVLAVEDLFVLNASTEAAIAGNQTYFGVIRQMAETGDFTVGQVAQVMASSRGHRMIVGSAETVAEAMIDWVETGSADGYVIMPALLPGDLIPFAERVVPLLREAGYAAPAVDRPLADRYRRRLAGVTW